MVQQVQAAEQPTLESVEKSTQSNTRAAALKYYLHDHSDAFRLQLIGALTVSSVAELDGCWRTAKSIVVRRKICLDLRGLNAIDEPARVWLKRLIAEDEAECLTATSGFSEALGKELGAVCRTVNSPARSQFLQRRFKGWVRNRLLRRGTSPQTSDDPSLVPLRCR